MAGGDLDAPRLAGTYMGGAWLLTATEARRQRLSWTEFRTLDDNVSYNPALCQPTLTSERLKAVVHRPVYFIMITGRDTQRAVNRIV